MAHFLTPLLIMRVVGIYGAPPRGAQRAGPTRLAHEEPSELGDVGRAVSVHEAILFQIFAVHLPERSFVLAVRARRRGGGDIGQNSPSHDVTLASAATAEVEHAELLSLAMAR